MRTLLGALGRRAFAGYVWLIVHDACPCRLGPVGSRLCGWVDGLAWRRGWW